MSWPRPSSRDRLTGSNSFSFFLNTVYPSRFKIPTVNSEDTIVAISTARGRAGIGVVRLSGPEALDIAQRMIMHEPPAKRPATVSPGILQAQRATLVNLIHPETGATLDEAVVTFFRAPKSYTGEDLVELSCHGSPVVLEEVVELAMALGARIAEPGEFTLRAFLNGRIDLVQAEAIHDLIEARTRFQAQVAIQQSRGALSRIISPVKEKLVEIIALLEAGIDFAEDDVPVASESQIVGRIEAVQNELARLLESYRVGRVVREGISLSIVGRPNVGKSSLFNRLLESDRAIVTEIPGTTRDLISETAQIHGIPVRLLDTAGIRTSQDRVEQEGVARSYAALAESDLILLVVDASVQWTGEDQALFEEVRALSHLIAFNKCDLGFQVAPPECIGASRQVRVSAKTGEGIAELQKGILEAVTGGEAGEPLAQSLITNLRHKQLLEECTQKLSATEKGTRAGQPHEVILLDLYGALRALDTLTGTTTVEDILGSIFSKFCIGK